MFNLRWRTRLILLLLVFSVLPAVLVAALAFETFQTQARTTTLEGLEGLAAAKAESIDQFTTSRIDDVQRAASLLSEEVVATFQAQTDLAEASTIPLPKPEELPKLQDGEDSEGGDETDDDADAPKEPQDLPDEPGGDGDGTETPSGPDGSTAPNVTKAAKELDLASKALRRSLGLLLGDQATFEELLVIAPDGRVIASTFRDHEGRTAEEIDYFKKGLAATFVQPVFISPITEELTMVIATPVRDENGVIAVLAARLNLKAFFRLINDTAGLGQTGETVVGRRHDSEVMFMAPTRHDPEAALTRTLRLDDDTGRPLTRTIRGDVGSGVAVDYRNEEVLAAWTFAETLEWGVVAKIDLAEANEPLWAIQAQLALIAALVSVIGALVALALSGAMVRPLRQLKDATEKISKGDFDVEIDIKSKDEIGELADSFERMIAAIKFFREQSREEDADELEDPSPAAPDATDASERE